MKFSDCLLDSDKGDALYQYSYNRFCGWPCTVRMCDFLHSTITALIALVVAHQKVYCTELETACIRIELVLNNSSMTDRRLLHSSPCDKKIQNEKKSRWRNLLQKCIFLRSSCCCHDPKPDTKRPEVRTMFYIFNMVEFESWVFLRFPPPPLGKKYDFQTLIFFEGIIFCGIVHAAVHFKQICREKKSRISELDFNRCDFSDASRPPWHISCKLFLTVTSEGSHSSSHIRSRALSSKSSYKNLHFLLWVIWLIVTVLSLIQVHMSKLYKS